MTEYERCAVCGEILREKGEDDEITGEIRFVTRDKHD